LGIIGQQHADLQQYYYFTERIVFNLQQNILFLQPMKLFFSIVSLVMLYISCLPCGDRVECNVRAEAKISAANDNHQQHKHNTEACSPFCSCSCCAASAFYSPLSKAQLNKVEFQSEKYPLYNVAFSTEAQNSIWQPPKLS
jgi:hypothetical protein